MVNEHSPLAIYTSLVQLKEVRLPTFKDFPEQVFIPAFLAERFEESLSYTEQDKRERFRVLKNETDASMQFSGGELRNNSQDIGFLAFLYLKYRSYFSQKALVEYHTHPNFPGRTSMSDPDILNVLVTPRLALVRAVVSRSKVEALFQTAAVPSMIAFSPLVRMREMVHVAEYQKKPLSEKAKFWQERGYVYYLWDKDKYIYDDGSAKSLENGFTLRRVN